MNFDQRLEAFEAALKKAAEEFAKSVEALAAKATKLSQRGAE